MPIGNCFACTWLSKFDLTKCTVMNINSEISGHDYNLGGNKLLESAHERDLGVDKYPTYHQNTTSCLSFRLLSFILNSPQIICGFLNCQKSKILEILD